MVRPIDWDGPVGDVLFTGLALLVTGVCGGLAVWSWSHETGWWPPLVFMVSAIVGCLAFALSISGIGAIRKEARERKREREEAGKDLPPASCGCALCGARA